MLHLTWHFILYCKSERRMQTVLPLFWVSQQRSQGPGRLLKPLGWNSCYGAVLLLCSLEGRFLPPSPVEILSAQPSNSGLGIREIGPLISFNSHLVMFLFFNLSFQFTTSFWPLFWYCTSINFDFDSRFAHSSKSFSRSPRFNPICAMDLPQGYMIATTRMGNNCTGEEECQL